MSTLLDGLPHQILSVAVALIPMAGTWFSYLSDRNPWRLLSILGWSIAGIAWFLRPAVSARILQYNRKESERLALLSKSHYTLLVVSGLLIVVLSLIVTYRSAA
jgi:hypothetical protein